MKTLTLAALNRATLARQLLLAREPIGCVEAVRRLGPLQAQEPKHPYVGLWSRLDGFERERLHEAVHAGELVRGTSLRGTLHLDAPAEHALLWPALSPVLARAAQRFADQLGGASVDDVLAVARAELQERPRTFAELRAALAERFPDARDRALGYTARMHLPLVMVPTEARWAYGADQRFALPEAPPHGDGDPAVLVRRHLAAFGPATAADVQAWSGVSGLADAVEGLGDELEAFRDERGRTLFDLPDAPRPDPEAPAPVRCLPEFDTLVLTHEDRGRVVADEHRARLTTKNLRVRATIIVDGRVAGTWTTSVKRRQATLDVQRFARLARGARGELEEEGEALLRFLEPDAAAWAVRFSVV